MAVQHKKRVKIKELRHAADRIAEIQRDIFKIKPKPLPKKIFAGHWRFIVVRSDVLRSSIGQQVQQVVNACNHWCLGKKKEPNSYRASTEVSYGPYSSGYADGQSLRPLSQDAWDKAGFPEFFKRKWFDVVTKYIKAGTSNIPQYKYFPKVPKHMLEYAYKPAYIKEVTEPDGNLEGELKKLYDFMNTNNGWARLNGRNKDEWDMSIEKKKQLSKIRDKEGKAEAAEI